MTDEEPWTNLPYDIGLTYYCPIHNIEFVKRKIDDDIGYGLFCPICHKEILDNDH